MKKSAWKLALILLCTCILAATATCAMAEDVCTVTVNGITVDFPDQQPYIKNDRVMVPVRAPMEAMGATVVWNDEDRSVTLTRGDKTAVFTVDSTGYTVNGEQLSMDVAPEIVNSRVAFPIRYCAEALGATVAWDGTTKIVAINDIVLTGRTIQVTEADKGKSIDMVVGDVLIITLESNPSTGYLWVFKANPDESCILVNESFIEPETDLEGASGHQEWTVTATKAGTVGIECGYSRPWEEAAPENVYGLTLNITDVVPAEIEYTIADSGKTATLKMGERLVVALESNPSTGYVWDFTQAPDAAILTHSLVQFEPGPDIPGAPGTDRWVFEPEAPGTTSFELAYSRPGSDEIPDKFMSMTVIVTE